MQTTTHIGAEHQALTAEERDTTAKERQGTVRRMAESLVDASRLVINAMTMVATTMGLRDLGIDAQMAKDADGRDYSVLPAAGDPIEVLHDAIYCLQIASSHLGKAYVPTRKYPSLATARRPEHMKMVLAGLRDALTSLRDELLALDLENSADTDPCIASLAELEARTCRAVPAPADGPTREDVVAAILSRPDIARAAAGALQRARC
ncbi:hypothetical protein [Streptomyces nanshensis]|uniref:hypothetical protein n=1 Tax=Streptomyces nanshensis TaxID=518642 RepID=UPI0009A059E9|nr:hypothetical protein [Streptomyces nanshensis]